jgi:hypothetical protein
MKIGFALAVALGAACVGCATQSPQQPAAAAAAPAALAPAAAATKNAAPPRYRERAAITGTRLPPVDDDDLGTASVGAMTRDEYLQRDMSRQIPRRGEPSGMGQ